MAGRAGEKRKGKVGVCIMCRKTFQCARSDKKTCGDKCRKAWQRYHEAMDARGKRDANQPEQSERLIALISEAIKHKYGARR